MSDKIPMCVLFDTSTTMTTQKADELWEKYVDCMESLLKPDFLAALAEYGAAVRARDVEICEEISGSEPSGHGGRYGALDCAEAIGAEPLP